MRQSWKRGKKATQEPMRPTAGDTSTPPRFADECFQLLRLTAEVQNDVEVVKPVLDELEVLRLSCAFGMLTSVNTKDFNMRMLEAREFDEDFTRFLRQKVFSDSSSKDEQETVRTVCLFGTQNEVKRQLIQWNCWSSDCENNLHEGDQGVYAVYKRTELNLNRRALVLFSWLQEELLGPHKLRNTATYMLRFLTCLSSHVVCCVSENDLPRIEHEIEDLSSKKKGNWKPYSVAFHVERQEDERDGIQCQKLRTIPLPVEVDSASDIRMIKGIFPALAVIKPVPSARCNKTTK